jgi:hypothetical protein
LACRKLVKANEENGFEFEAFNMLDIKDPNIIILTDHLASGTCDCLNVISFSSSAIVLIRMPGMQIRRIPRAPRTVPAYADGPEDCSPLGAV